MGRQGWVWGSSGASRKTIISFSVSEEITLLPRTTLKGYRKAIRDGWMVEKHPWDPYCLLALVSFNLFVSALNLGLCQWSCWGRKQSSVSTIPAVFGKDAFTGSGNRWGLQWEQIPPRSLQPSLCHRVCKKGELSTTFLYPAFGDPVVLWAVQTDRQGFTEGKEKRRFPLLSCTPAWLLQHLLTSTGKREALTLQLHQCLRETSVSGEVYLSVEKAAGRREKKGWRKHCD